MRRLRSLLLRFLRLEQISSVVIANQETSRELLEQSRAEFQSLREQSASEFQSLREQLASDLQSLRENRNSEIERILLNVNHNVADLQTRFEAVAQDVETLSAASLGLEMAARDLRAAGSALSEHRASH
jgi:predicted nuclease with TOPRIM domain